ncbi:hypothetical protein PENFLA_c020G08103 [Penicillium flavigenum]|uniref:Chitin-binding type-1 domain-containing protein n=1 Tax=Penicillium flavigenum TaxID=254877 RepID=A0A1V6SXW7_9EURO|nr:hypothetical protein PENFLA_c020G08103 [Penicillium flavigenum]
MRLILIQAFLFVSALAVPNYDTRSTDLDNAQVKRGNIIARQAKGCNTYKDCEQFGWVICCCEHDGPNDGFAGHCNNKFLAPCEPACKQL